MGKWTPQGPGRWTPLGQEEETGPRLHKPPEVAPHLPRGTLWERRVEAGVFQEGGAL